jgi:hypothetical protein
MSPPIPTFPSWVEQLALGFARRSAPGWQRLVQCSSPSSITGAGTPGCSRPTWRGRDGGLTIPWPSSNWWIKMLIAVRE